jgi:hypothetical protein
LGERSFLARTLKKTSLRGTLLDLHDDLPRAHF